MAHKIITLITSLALFTTAVPMDQSIISTKEDAKDEQKIESCRSTEEINYELITSTLYECGQIIKKMEKGIDIVDEKINVQSSELERCNKKLNALKEEIEISQKNITSLHNSSKNNNQHVDTLEESINHMTTSIQILKQHMLSLSSTVSQNYVTKEEATLCQEQLNNSLDDVKKKLNLFIEQKPHSTTAYKQYLLKIAPPAAIIACIAILYRVRKPLQKKMHATLKKIRSFFSRKKTMFKKRVRA